MRIVIEDFPYDEQKLREVVPARMLDFPNKKGEIRPPYVGYCFNPEINDCIFFLPKVVLTKDRNDEQDETGVGLVFDKYNPTELLDFDTTKLDDSDRKFLQNFAIWIYRAISVFYKHNDTTIVSCHSYVEVDASPKKKEGTLIDVILSLIKFAKENRDFVLFEIKNIHTGYNRVNWRKTISHQLPTKQGKSPIYFNPINKKKQIDFDEELFVIFFSILEYVHKQFNFPVEINCNFDTINSAEFRHYLSGYGKIRLRQIKYKYFSDKALKLWNLCYQFFDNSDRLNSTHNVEDFLIAKDFNIVFESIIESLLGEEVPKGFKEQYDGKRIDHIYPYNALVHSEENIYHIADSKYYKVGSSIGKESIYKQYTYAKNVIQLTLNILFGRGDMTTKKRNGYIPYRDDITEGYNITPNFFISAKIESEDSRERYSYSKDNLTPHDVDAKGKPIMKHRIFQFENRLFDRDTLILSHYDINFLYIIALYGKNNHFEQDDFRYRARKIFRDFAVRLISDYYSFYKVDPSPESIEEFVDSHFRELSGKLFHFDKTLILALEKDHPDSKRIKDKFDSIISPYSLLIYNG